MKIKVGDVTYTSIKKNSLAYYLKVTFKAIGYLLATLSIVAFLWLFFSAIIIVLG